MSNVWFTSDWHLGHTNLHEYQVRGDGYVTDVDKNYEWLEANWKAGWKRDHVYFLGDMIFEDRAIDFLDSLPAAKKVLILGNHDYERFTPDYEKLFKTFDEVKGMRSYKNTWLTHCPIHQEEMRRKFVNIHGHLHDPSASPEITANPRYFNVNVDCIYPKYGQTMLNFQFIRNEVWKRIVIEEMMIETKV